MRKAIICTTINQPTKAIKAFLSITDWDLIIIGDLKTPHESYENLDLLYLSPSTQEFLYPELSKAIGWNCIQRRNIGFVHAYKLGYDIIATVDDDNIPNKDWGQEIIVGETLEIDFFNTNQVVFDPFSPYIDDKLWHRGFPIQLIRDKNQITKSRRQIKVLVQAHLVNGDPDIDAICRIIYKPYLSIEENIPYYSSNKIMPFNSQNTILHRDVIPYYFMFPGVGRMDDIWGSYILQDKFPNSVAFGNPNVTQIRNQHDLMVDFKAELIGYEYSIKLVQDLANYNKYIPKDSIEAYEIYKKHFI